MRSWSRPSVPDLTTIGLGSGPALQLTNSRGHLVPVDPDEHARLYVCGITPYDATHLGHANTYVAFDLIQRMWLDRGLDVTYTQNVTDVDDPLLERANQTGQDWVALAERETQLFRDDMTALRVLPPEHYVGAVESIPLVVDMIKALQSAGAVYEVDTDLYFDAHADAAFGEVSGFDADTMRELFGERGGDPERPGKRHPLDCLVWQAERPGEPAWDSVLGRGRPGWHIECAAIALEHLGRAFDVQGGGSDLVFPHHEMSASEAAVTTGEPFARHYVHAGMVGLDGEKMSKSKGNLVLVSALREANLDPMVIRLALLSEQYRTDWEWFDSHLEVAQARLDRWRAALVRPSAPEAVTLVGDLRAALANDLDTPAALAIVDAWADTEGDDADAPRVVGQALDALLGIV